MLRPNNSSLQHAFLALLTLFVVASACKQADTQVIGVAPTAQSAEAAPQACTLAGQGLAEGEVKNKTLFNPAPTDCSNKIEVSCRCLGGVLTCPTETEAKANGYTVEACTPGGGGTTTVPDGETPAPSNIQPGTGISDFILGMYDNGGEHMLSAGAEDRGWVLMNRHLKSPNHSGPDVVAIDLMSRGFGVITRLNWDYEGDGTIAPPGSSQEATMLSKMRDMVSGTPNAKVWIIGNEPNRKAESYDKTKAIPPADYAKFYNTARALIKSLPGHENDLVLPAALSPASGDYSTAQYFNDMMQHIPNFDGLAVHAKPSSGQSGFFLFNEGDAITTHARAAGKPIFITEANPKDGWNDSAHGTWVEDALKAVKAFNDRGTARIMSMVVYRYHHGQNDWENFSNKNQVGEGFKRAAQLRIKWN